MKIEKIDHIAILVSNLAAAEKVFSDLLGTTFQEFSNIAEMDVHGKIDPLGIELMEPLLPDGPTSKLLQKRGEGMLTLSLKVADLDAAMAEFKARGVRLVGQVSRGKWKAAVYHPRDACGVMIELIEYPTEHPMIAASLT